LVERGKKREKRKGKRGWEDGNKNNLREVKLFFNKF